MKKIFFSGVSLVSRLALLLAMALTGFASANAAGLTGEIELGKEYPFTSFSSVDVYFVAPADGTVMQFALEGVYKDAEHTDQIQTKYGGYADGVQYWTYEVVKGETYYVYTDFAWNGGNLKVTMAGQSPLELMSRTFAEGEAFDFNNYTYLTYTFNEPVEFTSVKITCGDQTVTPSVDNYNGSVNVYVDGIKALVEAGTIQPGSIASVVFEGLKGVTSGKLYNDKETATFTFKVSAVGVKAVSEVWPTVFKSYWPKGSEEGIIKLTFSKELSKTGAVCQLVYGNTEGTLGEDLYVEEIVPTVDGNTITVDLTGKRRANDDMILSGPYTVMTVKVANILDIDGFPVSSPGAGTVGSYSATLDYEDIPRANLTYETVPANGGSLQGVSNFEFWLSGLNSISFDGFKIAYTDAEGAEKEVTVPMSAVAKSEVSADGNDATFKFELPEEARNQKNYKISLNNLEALDGYDHSFDVTAQFDAFVLTYVSPANGTKMAGLEEDQVIKASFNVASEYPEMYVVYEVEDMNPTNPDEAIVKSQTWMNRQDNGEYTAEIPMFVKMLAGHTYKCTFTAWATEMDKNYKEDPIGTASVEWYGTTEPFKFSDVQFVSIAPAAGTTITQDDRTFVLTFDGMVNLPTESNFINLGQGSTMKFESLTPVIENVEEATTTDYSNIWTAVVPASYMSTLEGALTLSFKAYDMDNALVEGNTGDEEQSYFGFSYELAKDSKDEVSEWEFTPAQGKVTELSKIDIVFTTYNEVAIGNGYPTLSVNGGEAQRLNDAEYDPVIYNKVSLNLGQTYTAAGTYVISFPAGYFTDENGNNLPAFTLTYEIEGQQAAETKDYEVMPESGKYEVLESFYMFADEGIKVAEGTELSQAVVMNMAREIVAYVDNVEYDDYGCMIYLNEQVTAAGNYTLIIPEGYFTIAGTPSAEKMMYYSVTGKFTVTADPAPGMVKSLKTIKLTASAPVMMMGEGFTITPEGGEDIEITDITTNSEEEGWFATEFTLTLPEEITALGKYTLTIPSYFFMFESYTYNQEAIEFEYEVVDKVPEVTDAWTITPAQGKVTELSTIEITFDGYQEVGIGSGFPTLSIDGGEAQRLNDAELDWDVWNKVALNLGETYTAAGTYVISFPAGYFVADDDDLPAFTLTYEIEGQQAAETKDYEVMPESGMYEVLESFYMFADEGIKVAEGTELSQAVVMNMAREIVAYVDNVEYDDYGCMIYLNEQVTAAGNYTLIIPEGYFTIAGTPSAEKMMYYSVTGKFTVTADPAPGMVKSLKTIKLTTSAPVMMMGEGFTITPEGGEDIEITDITTNSEEEGWFATEFTLTLPEEITALGKYTLTIPSYFFMFESYTYNQEAIEFEYEVVDKVPEVTDAWTITPAQGKVTELSKIEITFNGYEEVGIGGGFPTLSIDGGEAQRLNDAELDWDVYNKVALNLGETYTAAGTYVISFPAGYFIADGDDLPAFTLTYTIEKTSGIEGIAADENGKYVVYNLSGYRVMETENAEDLKQLTNGLYIINGVKVYKK